MTNHNPTLSLPPSLSPSFPPIDMEPVTVGIMLVAVGVKVSLYLYSSTRAGISGTAEALAEDHKHDIMTNSFSVISSTVAH